MLTLHRYSTCSTGVLLLRAMKFIQKATRTGPSRPSIPWLHKRCLLDNPIILLLGGLHVLQGTGPFHPSNAHGVSDDHAGGALVRLMVGCPCGPSRREQHALPPKPSLQRRPSASQLAATAEIPGPCRVQGQSGRRSASRISTEFSQNGPPPTLPPKTGGKERKSTRAAPPLSTSPLRRVGGQLPPNRTHAPTHATSPGPLQPGDQPPAPRGRPTQRSPTAQSSPQRAGIAGGQATHLRPIKGQRVKGFVMNAFWGTASVPGRCEQLTPNHDRIRWYHQLVQVLRCRRQTDRGARQTESSQRQESVLAS